MFGLIWLQLGLLIYQVPRIGGGCVHDLVYGCVFGLRMSHWLCVIVPSTIMVVSLAQYGVTATMVGVLDLVWL